MHTKGYAAPETKGAVDQARLLIERAEALGEPPEDPMLLFSVLYGIWTASLVAFNGDVVLNLAAEFLSLAEKHETTAPLLLASRIMGTSLLCTGNIAESRVHLDRAIALYDPAVHRPLATRFGQDVGVAALSHRSRALWILGYPEAALADAQKALRDAREIGQAANLMYALPYASLTYFYCGNYATANTIVDELIALANDKGSDFHRTNISRFRLTFYQFRSGWLCFRAPVQR
jgi:predicted ATPase